jgi:hypothetical protein
MLPAKTCPNCGGANLYARRASPADIHGTSLLPGLGSFLHFAEVDVVVCADCGLTQLFAEPSAREKVLQNRDWRRIHAD